MKIEAGKIAIIRLGSIGDVINTLPLLNRLRKGYPNSQIDWIVEKKSAPFLDNHPSLDHLVVFPRERPTLWPQFVKRLRRTKYDLILDCQRIIRSGLLTWLSGAPYRVGFDHVRCKEGSWVFTNARIPSNDCPGVMLEQFLEFAEFLELPACPVSWKISLESEERLKVNRLIGKDGHPPIVINVGASKPEKHWPVDYFISLIRMVTKCWKGKIVLSGGEEDRTRATQIASASGIQDVVGLLSLRELCALSQLATLVVSGDTGPLHVAVAMGTQVLGLYGPSSPARTGPYNQSESVIAGVGNPGCPACKHVCGDPYALCMRSITPEMVFQGIEKKLGGHPAWNS